MEEVEYIANNYQKIENIVKTWNELSDIVFITHENVEENVARKINNLFWVDIGKGEELNKKPITSNEELFNILSTAKYPKREANFQFQKEKKLKLKTSTILKRMKRRVVKLLSLYTYSHKKQY